MTPDAEWIVLWEGCLAGDPARTRAFLLKVYPLVQDLFQRRCRDAELAQDLAQGFFLNLFEKEMHRLRSYRADLGVPLPKYLNVLAMRYYIDWMRSRRGQASRREASLDEVIDILGREPDVEEILIRGEVYKAVASLPQRECEGTQWALQGLRGREIARLMGLTEGGVAALLWRARQHLAKLLAGGWSDPRPAEALSQPDDERI